MPCSLKKKSFIVRKKLLTVLLKILPKVLLWYCMIWMYLFLSASWDIVYFEKRIIHCYARIIFRKINISDPQIRTRPCAYQGVRNVSFSEYFAYALYEWSQGLYWAIISWKLFCSSQTWFFVIYCNDWIEVKLKRPIRIS